LKYLRLEFTYRQIEVRLDHGTSAWTRKNNDDDILVARKLKAKQALFFVDEEGIFQRGILFALLVCFLPTYYKRL